MTLSATHSRLAPALLLALLGTGCSGEDPNVDPAPFQRAFEAHLEENRMGVTFSGFEELTVEGDRAHAEVRVAHEQSTGLAPRWKVTFERDGQSWRVSKVDR